jgi:hypothetical protein
MSETEAPEATPQSVADYAYRKGYLAWVASLTAADRALLKTMNLDKPDCVCGGGGGCGTMIEVNEDHANHGWHPGEVIDDEEPEPINEDDIDRLKCYDPEILKTLLRVLIFPDRGRAGNYKSAFARLVALGSALHIDGIGDRSLEYLAGKIGCTRQLLSFYVVQLRDFGGLDCYGGKSLKAREAYAVGQLWRTKSKRKGGVPGNATEKITEGAV